MNYKTQLDENLMEYLYTINSMYAHTGRVPSFSPLREYLMNRYEEYSPVILTTPDESEDIPSLNLTYHETEIRYHSWKRASYLLEPIVSNRMSPFTLVQIYRNVRNDIIVWDAIPAFQLSIPDGPSTLRLAVYYLRKILATLKEFCDTAIMDMMIVYRLHLTSVDVKWNFENTILESRETITPLELEEIRINQKPKVILNY